MKKTSFFLFLILLLSLPLIFPFFRSGYFPTHDGEWAVVRLGAMHRALMAGHFPVRWAGNLNFSFGYPLFLFTYPLPYYLGEGFYLLGFGLVGAIKTLFVLSVIFSGLAMFLLGKELFGAKGGLIAAVFYLYAPFRLVDLYVRGSLGESLAFIFFPLLFWILLKIVQGRYYWAPIGAVFFAGLLLTHNVSALLATPFLIAFAIFLIFKTSKKKRSWLTQQMLSVFILGLGLSAFFLIPALTEKGNIILSQIPLADVRKHFVNLSQLIIPSWGYGSPGSEDAFSFQLGGVHLIGLLLGLGFWLKDEKKTKNLPSLFFGFSFASLVVLVLSMLPVSFLFWEKAPLFSEIDFPWRALGLASFFLAAGVGYLAVNSSVARRNHPVSVLGDEPPLPTKVGSSATTNEESPGLRTGGFFIRSSRYFAVGLVILVIFINLGYAKPSGFIDYEDAYYLTNEATTTSNDELMPIWVKEKPIERPKEKVEILSGEGIISNLVFNSKTVSFDVGAETKLEVQINTIYFPGWRIKTDGKEIPLQYQNEKGVMRLTVEPGKHQVVAEFGETSIRFLADIISLTSLVLVGGLLIKRKRVK